MFCGPAMKFGARLLCVVAAVIACACRAEPGSLAYSAKEAKRQGKQAITIRHIFDEIGSEAPLDRVALLLQGRLDIFEVMPDGRIVVPTTPWFRYMQDMMKLGTIDRLTEHLKALRRPRDRVAGA